MATRTFSKADLRDTGLIADAIMDDDTVISAETGEVLYHVTEDGRRESFCKEFEEEEKALFTDDGEE